MLTTKNPVRKDFIFFLTLVALLAGCTPPGPRALSKGERLIDQGHYAEAVEQLKRAASLFSNTNAQVWNDLGLAYQGAGQPTNAVPAYRKALALDHNLAEARYNLGCLWLEQDQPEAAKAELISYTSLRRNAVEGWLKLGTAQLRLREPAAAEKSFDEALKISPQNPEALNGRGLVWLQHNRPRDAARCFEDALKQQPDYSPALLNLAVVSERDLNNPSLALQKYREYLVLPLRPGNWEAVNSRAAALEQELKGAANPVAAAVSAPAASVPGGNVAKAASGSPGSSRMEPAPAGLKTAPAFVAVESRENVKPPAEPDVKPAKAVASASKPAPVKPSTPVLASPKAAADAPKSEKPGFFSRMNPLNWFRGSETDSNPSAALAKPGRYTYRSPARPAVGDESAARQAFTQALQAQQADRLPEAIQGYRQATQLDPAYFDAYYNLGLAATSAGDLPRALQAYETALAIRSDSPAARYNFALALKQANYPADAANELEKVLAVSPREPRAHLALANLYAQPLHQPAKAREHYLKVLENDPYNPQAAAIRNWLGAPPQ